MTSTPPTTRLAPGATALTKLDGATPWRATLGASRVTFGPGAVADLPEIVGRIGGRRVLLVTDAGVRATGAVDRAADALRGASLHVQIFDGVEENPTNEHVETGRQVAREAGSDLIVGFGGGSSMDAAKGINFLVTNGGRMRDYHGDGKATRPMLPSIGIPTTAGTGSEAQRFALITRRDDHLKMACGDERARFREVVLDPELTATVPPAVAVATGLDALSHAVESYVSTPRNPVSRMYARESWGLLARAFPAALGEPDDVEVRGRMMLGAHFAGAAIECSMLGAAHACANPLTARFDVTHGIAVGLLLPHVVRYNEPAAALDYADLVRVFPGERPLVAVLEDLFARTRVAPQLRDHGVDADAIPELARMAATQWTAGFNPRAVSETELRRIYEDAY